MTTQEVLRNAATIANSANGFVTAHLEELDNIQCVAILTELIEQPFAIVECKRVGVEEGMRKGPQTIEKAKQGAYVARSVSGLQKFRQADGQVRGIVDMGGGQLRSGSYVSLMREIIDGDSAALLRQLILTVGVVSNHGNWFTGDDHNKELRVLSHSYDWLLFLTDKGLCQFIEKLLVKPIDELKPAREAFLASYGGQSGSNCFTKVKVRLSADRALKYYFDTHEAEVESWFNVIGPPDGTIQRLREDFVTLAGKNWTRIHRP